MALTTIITLAAESFRPDSIRQTTTASGGVNVPQRIAFGTQVQEPVVAQIVSEWDDTQESASLIATPEYLSFISRVRSSSGEVQRIYHVQLNRTVFGTDGPATGNVIEFAQNFFPVSRATPEFQRKVEEDFLRFDETYSEGAQTDTSVAYGWAVEEQEHEDVKGEKAKCFMVCRGWETMDRFQQSLRTDAFQKAIPILFAWNAPYKMWHVERKPVGGI